MLYNTANHGFHRSKGKEELNETFGGVDDPDSWAPSSLPGWHHEHSVMRYKAGKVGRVVLARFDHGEQVVPALTGLCETEGIKAGWFFLFGAIQRGRLVSGPRNASLPPEPVWQEFKDPFEVLGMGSIAAGCGPPSIHLHASLGRGKEVLTGCVRKEGEVFLVVEAMVLEILGIRAARSPDKPSGLELLTVE